jgi:N-glycosylase/DNA lyase
VGVVGRRVVRLGRDAAGVRLLSPAAAVTREAIRRYLGVVPRERHPRRAEAALAADPIFARVLPHTAGISLLAQDPWEILISFIVSQNNNIPKITRSIEGLARALGEPLGDGVFAFPDAERLARASMRTLAACALGYRAPYVRAAARLVAGGRLDLAALARMDHDAAREALLDVPGIGEKVGDCVLLFGLGHRAAFPVDVWVRRAVERLYFRGRPRTLRDIQAFARERFGPLAGYAQQHLFVYARTLLGPRSMPVN